VSRSFHPKPILADVVVVVASCSGPDQLIGVHLAVLRWQVADFVPTLLLQFISFRPVKECHVKYVKDYQ
jgi:hypothetical protein